MPDAIDRVDFTSRGAPASAKVGTYPIYPGRVRFTTSVRVRYSVRYVPGTMTVADGGSSPISFVRQAQQGWENEGVGATLEFELPVAPDTGNLLLVIIGTAGTQNTTAPRIADVTDGGGLPFDQVGGSSYYAEHTLQYFVSPATNENYSLSMWYRTADASIDAATVKVKVNGGGANARYNVYVMEYHNADGSPVTDSVKGSASHDETLVGAVNVYTLPDLDLNGSTGQCVVCAYLLCDNSGDGVVSAGYAPRYNAAGGTFDFAAVGVAVMDRVGLSGTGPENPTYRLTPSPATVSGFSGMAVALRKG